MRRNLILTLLFVAAVSFSAQLETRSWQVNGLTRQALVYMPKSAEPPPMVFVFHGHGGNMKNGARSFRIHKLWPEAAVVYMQGLPTPGTLTDPEGKKNGWNADPTDPDNRDLLFFDAVFSSLESRIDTNRVFSTGHSNGGAFTYCLWAARGDYLTATAPSAALSTRAVKLLKPKPALHVAGTNDSLVKYGWQARMINAVKKINGCTAEGRPWQSSGDLTGTLYPSPKGTPVITLISPGSHKFPATAPELIVQFFKTSSEEH